MLRLVMIIRACIALLVAVPVLCASTAAHAAASCISGAATVSVMLTADEDAAVISISPLGAILVNGAPCDDATVENTDTVYLASTASGSQTLTIDGADRFAPGLTPEPGQSEIEFVVDLGDGEDRLIVIGSERADAIAIGSFGIDWNAAEQPADVDVSSAGVEDVEIHGLGGNDSLLANEGTATGTAYSLPVLLDGGEGRDSLIGGNGADRILGGPHSDFTLRGGAGDDFISGGDGIEMLEGGRGDDRLLGGSGRDYLHGGEGANLLNGGPDDDRMSASIGSDEFRGGSGGDTIHYKYRAAAVRVSNDGVADDGGRAKATTSGPMWKLRSRLGSQTRSLSRALEHSAATGPMLEQATIGSR